MGTDLFALQRLLPTCRRGLKTSALSSAVTSMPRQVASIRMYRLLTPRNVLIGVR